VQFDSGRSCITLFNSIAAHYCHLWQWRGGERLGNELLSGL
jgi:hypothetical protein